MALYDGYDEQYENPYPGPNTVHPGANTGSGPWAPGYDPGPNWNGGNPGAPPSPRYDWNNDSPPDQALTPGHGWTWQGPQTPIWDMGTNQWQRGVWQETAGSGKGLVLVEPTSHPYVPPPPRNSGDGGGAVPSVGGRGGQSGISIPSATLPANIASIFSRVPEKTPMQSMYQDALTKYMGRAQEMPSLSDATLAPQVEVFRAANQRNTERQRRSAVERAGVGQNQSGYLDNVIENGVQQQGFQNAQYNANLLGGEMDKRRKELQAGLQLAAATGDAEAARELQTRLAQVQAAMSQQALNLQGQLGFGDLDLRRLLGTEQLNQNALQLIMGGL